MAQEDHSLPEKAAKPKAAPAPQKVTPGDRRSLAAWTKQRHTPNRRCETCTTYAHLLPLIGDFIRAKQAGSQRSYAEFWREWLKPRGYNLSLTAFEKHVRRCAEHRGG